MRLQCIHPTNPILSNEFRVFRFVPKSEQMTRQEQMYRLIEEQQAGEQTAAAFCEQRGVKLGTFNYWLRKKRQNAKPSFVAIDVEPVMQGKTELIYPNGVRLRLDRFDYGQIRQLIYLV